MSASARLEYPLLRAGGVAIRALPHGAIRPLGKLLGRMLFALDGRHRRIARRNLELVFPSWPAARRERVARGAFAAIAASALESVSLGRLSPEQICSRLELEGWSHFAAAEERGRGVFVLSAHLGIHELIAPVVALYKGPTALVARSFADPRAEREINGLRQRFGNRVLPHRGAARQMLRAVAAGGRVALLLDQRVHPNLGIELPFLGQPSFVSPILARMSRKTGASVLPLFALPEPGGRYRIRVRPAIPPTAAGDAGDADLTGRYLRAIEREIRERPADWLWMHERWRRH